MQNRPGTEKTPSGTEKDFSVEIPASESDVKMHAFLRVVSIFALAVFIVGTASFLIRAFS